MTNRKNIENELIELGSSLQGIIAANPYEAPEGYFERLPEAVLARAKNEEFSPVLNRANTNPYLVPEGYFENLADTLLNRVKAMEAGSAKEELELLSPVLKGLQKTNPYRLPQGYFEELADNVTEGAKAIELVNEELENLSPLMSGLKSINPYQVPADYFESFANEVLEKAKRQQPAKVVSIGFGKKWRQYAAAAVMAGLILTAALFIINKPAGNNEEAIAKEMEKKIDKVSDEELFKFFEEEAPVNTATVINSNPDDIDASDMKEMLADVSDEELQAYVEQSGSNANTTIN
jgi:hypothetical protein